MKNIYNAFVFILSIIIFKSLAHFTTTLNIQIPQDISVEVVQNTTLNFKSCDKESLGLFAAQVRSWRPPEPYKGKGIIYENEIVRRKAGKSGKK